MNSDIFPFVSSLYTNRMVSTYALIQLLVLYSLFLTTPLTLDVFFYQSLLSCVAFGYGCETFAKYEQQGVGIQWYNINLSPEEGNHYTFIVSIFMMLIDAAIYWVLTWYIENVFPGTWWISLCY